MRREKGFTPRFGLVASLVAAAALVPPDRPLPFDLCFLQRLAGFPCMTCGLTRAICHLLRGDWEASLHLHPAGGLLLAALLVAAVWMGAEAVRGRAADAHLQRRLIALLAGAGGLLAALHRAAGLLS